jgi:biopolymer transport protein ExbD
MLTANSPNALDLLLPKAKGKSTNTQNVSVTINRNLEYFVNNQRINGEYVEIELKKALEGQEKPTIILRAEESVAIKEAVSVMDIANRNNYKVILAVRPN